MQSVKRGERRDRESGLRVRTLRDLLRQQRCAKVAPKDAHRRRCYKGDTRDGVRQVRQAARGFARVVEGEEFQTLKQDAHIVFEKALLSLIGRSKPKSDTICVQSRETWLQDLYSFSCIAFLPGPAWL